MVQTTWIFLAIGVGIFYLATHPDKVKESFSFNCAKYVYVLSFFITLVIKGIQANEMAHGTSLTAGKLIRFTMWSEGISWALLGLVVYFLISSACPQTD